MAREPSGDKTLIGVINMALDIKKIIEKNLEKAHKTLGTKSTKKTKSVTKFMINKSLEGEVTEGDIKTKINEIIKDQKKQKKGD